MPCAWGDPVPGEVADRVGPLGPELAGLPHGWITGDDEFGRSSNLRRAAPCKERYVLDVPCNTLVRDLERRPPRRRKAGRGRKPKAPFQRVDAWAKGQPGSGWMRLTVRDAEKGPLEVEAMMVRVQAKQDHRVGPEETLVVLRTVGETRIDYALANLGPDVTLPEVVGAQRQRHRIEELFQAGNGEAGLDHYEVRSWAGWHHHMTLALVALWFLCLERRRVGGKNPRDHGVAEAASVHALAPRSAPDLQSHRRRGLAGIAA